MPLPLCLYPGVRVDSTSGSQVRVSWEGSGDGRSSSQPSAQAGSASEASDIAGEVGVPHSSIDLWALDAGFRAYLRQIGQRGGTYSTRRGEAKDAGMAGATRIGTPDKVRQLQIALYRKAKAEPKYRLTADHGGLESRPMNEFGEPNMGNPSVRLDEGRERVGHWPCAFQSIRARLLYTAENQSLKPFTHLELMS